ncbi:MAG: hypothetical protein HY293_07080, partial [Planctomycetes bacterium]|nr:hypothetical protein [Planctomycetota bacterium]
MRHARFLALALMPLVAGCDLAVGIYFATRSKDSRVAATPLPSVNLAATDATASEAGGNTGTFTITRTGSTSAALDVFFTVSGTASAPADYATLTSPVTLPAGQASVTLTVTPVNDAIAEGVETVIVTITATATYTIEAPGNATVTIDDDDDNRYHVWVANLTAGQ